MSETRMSGVGKRWLGYAVMLILSGTCFAQYGVRTDGARIGKLAKPGDHAVVLFFVASDCPISDRTFPEMKRVREEFTTRGVAVWFVYPNTTEHAVEVEKHQRGFDSGGEVLLDPDGELVRLAGAKVTPEVSVLVPSLDGGWKLVYSGRVDDRFVHLGLERPRITEHFAEDVLNAVLDGKPVPKATGTPVGCGIIAGGTPR